LTCDFVVGGNASCPGEFFFLSFICAQLHVLHLISPDLKQTLLQAIIFFIRQFCYQWRFRFTSATESMPNGQHLVEYFICHLLNSSIMI